MHDVRSKYEANQLKRLKELGIPHEYESETFKYMPVNPVKKYTPDIVMMKKDGNKMYIELKGYFKGTDRAKHLGVRKSCPELDIRFVFQNANAKLSKASKTTYGEWATKNNFLWAHKDIPLDWLEEIDINGI